MKKRKLSVLLLVGVTLILLSLVLVSIFLIRGQIGAVKCREVAEKMQALLPEKSPGVPELYGDPNMPVLEIDGKDYVALLEIPAWDLTLPVADSWNKDRLYEGPARFSGSAYDGTLVIGGVDDARQLGFCDKIENGTEVTVTDMTGASFSYTVSRVDRAKQADARWLMNSEFDLTLFCRDLYSMEYVAVRCSH